MCVLVGYGADAICPYMVFEIAQMLKEENVIEVNDETAYENYAAAVDRGISKVIFDNFCTFILHIFRKSNFNIIQCLANKTAVFGSLCSKLALFKKF